MQTYEYKHVHATLKDHKRKRIEKLQIMSNQRLGEEKEESSPLIILLQSN